MNKNYHKEYYQKHKEVYKANNHKFYNENKELVKTRLRKYAKENPDMRLYHSAKSTAKRRGLEFSITPEDVVVPLLCPYFGVPLTHEQGRGRVQTNASIDRIDSTKGYIKGNIQVISELANRMKSDATPEQLQTFAKGVLKTWNSI